jgi:hypothetical protein
MDLGDIIRLLGILFFIVIPIVRAIMRRAQPQPPQKAPVEGQVKPTDTLVSTVPTSTVSTVTTGQFEKRLEQARKQVQEAMKGQNTSGGLMKPETTRGGLGQESSEGMFRPSKPELPKEMRGFPKDVHGSTLPEEFHQKAKTVGAFIPEASHKGLIVAPSMQKAPQSSSKHTKLDKHILLSKDMLSEQELTRGLLWQQILSEPRSKQKRRTLSQHR